MAASDKVNTQATLVIGLGGAGGQVLARLKRLIHEGHADRPQVRDLVSYLAIDADKFDRLDELTRATLDPQTEFLFLTGFNPREAYRSYLATRDQMEDLGRWFPAAEIDLLRDQQVEDGASRCRPVGRFYLYHNRNIVRRRIGAAIDEAMRVRPGLQVDNGSLRILVLSSSCGGTGSSAFLDIVYMVQQMLRAEGKNVRLEAVVLLPEPFIRRASAQTPGLEPFLRANGYAFFREVDWILKYPDRFNGFAMDAASAGRADAGVGGRGLPPNMQAPIDTVYLVDEGVSDGGLGIFADLPDLYDFTSRAVFYRLFSPEIVAASTSRESNVESFKSGVDPIHRRPLRYAALGYGEVRRPNDFVTRLAGLLARRDGLAYGLVGESWAGMERDVAASADGERIAAMKLVQMLEERQEAAVQARVGRIPGLEVFQDSKGRVDASQLDAGSLQQAVDSARDAVESGKRELDALLRQESERLLMAFDGQLRELCEGLADGNGLLFLHEILGALNGQLEDEVEQAIRKSKVHLDAAKAAAERSLGGSATSPPVIAEILEARKSKRDQLLAGLMGGLKEYADQQLRGHAALLAGELLRAMAGDKGKDPILLQYNENSRRYEAGLQPKRSVVDRRYDQVNALMQALRRCADDERPEAGMRAYLKALGCSPTVEYFPDQFHSGHWVDDHTLRGAYHREFPGLQAGNDLERQKARRGFVKEALRLLEEGHYGGVFSLLADDATRSRFLSDLERFAVERVSRADADDLLGVMQSLDGRARTEVVARLKSHSHLACRLDADRYIDQQGKDWIWNYGYYGGGDEKRAQDMVQTGSDFSFFRTPEDRLVLLRVRAIFPFWICRSIASLESEYFRRSEGNRPHVDHRLNRGGMESEDPGFVLGRGNPLRTFFKLYGLSLRMLDDPDCKERLATVVRFDEKSGKLHQFPTSFLWANPDPTSSLCGINAMTWELSEDKGGHHLLVPTLTRPIRVTGLFERGQPRADRTRDYCCYDTIVGNHSRIVEALEKHREGREEIIAACESLEAEWMKQLEALRQSPIYKAAVQKVDRGDVGDASEKVTLSNEDWYTAAIQHLRGIQEELAAMDRPTHER